MQGDELKALRKQAGLTQIELAKVLDLSPTWVGQMERGDVAIEPRTEKVIDGLIRTRIDVSYSEALGKWVVAIIKPGATFAGREHHLIAAKPTEHEAREIALEKWEEGGKFAMLIHRARA